VSGPLAGLISDQTLNASVHSAAIRAGTVHDGHIQNAESISSRPPSWMVDPLCQQSLPPSLAERESQRISRSIRRPRHTRDTSTAQAPMLSKSDIGTFNPTMKRNARADTAALPYTEVPNRPRSSLIVTERPNNAMRGGMWNIHAARALDIHKSRNYHKIRHHGRAQRPSSTQRLSFEGAGNKRCTNCTIRSTDKKSNSIPTSQAKRGVRRRPESTNAQGRPVVVQTKSSWVSWWRPEADTARSMLKLESK
jgi:hypothetical protein